MTNDTITLYNIKHSGDMLGNLTNNSSTLQINT